MDMIIDHDSSIDSKHCRGTQCQKVHHELRVHANRIRTENLIAGLLHVSISVSDQCLVFYHYFMKQFDDNIFINLIIYGRNKLGYLEAMK